MQDFVHQQYEGKGRFAGRNSAAAFSALLRPRNSNKLQIAGRPCGIPRPQHKIATDRRRTAIRCLLKGVPCFLKRPESYRLLLITGMQFHNKTPISRKSSCEHLMIWDQSICYTNRGRLVAGRIPNTSTSK